MHSRGKYGHRHCQSGITLIELLIVLAVLATLAGIAAAGYRSYRTTSQIDAAKREIIEISSVIERYHLANNAWPDTLADIGYSEKLDPWGNNYIYARIPSILENVSIGGTMLRQDANLRPINTFYDLYSMGEDGKTTNNISAPISHDDVIRAQDGEFIGLAQDY